MPDELPADPPDVAGTDPGSRPSGCAEPERRSGHEGREHERGGAPAAPTPVPAGAPGDRVTRSVVVGADVADVWHAVADPGERALWLDDPDAAARRVRIEESSPEHRLVWTWWRPGDERTAPPRCRSC